MDPVALEHQTLYEAEWLWLCTLYDNNEIVNNKNIFKYTHIRKQCHTVWKTQDWW